MAEFSKTTFSVVDVTKLVTIVALFIAQHYSLKNEIHDAVTMQVADKQIYTLQLSQIRNDVSDLEKKWDAKIQYSDADKPKPVKIPDEWEQN